MGTILVEGFLLLTLLGHLRGYIPPSKIVLAVISRYVILTQTHIQYTQFVSLEILIYCYVNVSILSYGWHVCTTQVFVPIKMEMGMMYLSYNNHVKTTSTGACVYSQGGMTWNTI